MWGLNGSSCSRYEFYCTLIVDSNAPHYLAGQDVVCDARTLHMMVQLERGKRKWLEALMTAAVDAPEKKNC